MEDILAHFQVQAVTKLLIFNKFNTNNSSNHNQMKFYLIDVSHNSKYKNKVYCYVGSRVNYINP